MAARAPSWARATGMGDSAVSDFARDGFLVSRALWRGDECGHWRSQLLKTFSTPWTGSARVGATLSLHAPGAGRDPENPLGLHFVQQLGMVDPKFLALALDARLVALAVLALGTGDLNLHSLKASLKPPGYVSSQGWHQDATYIKEEPAVPGGPTFVTILVSCDETAPGAGATQLVPGSHARGLLGDEDREDRGESKGVVTDAAARRVGTPVSPAMAAGDAIVLSPDVIHAVGANETERTRCALAFVYKAASATDRQPGGNPRAFAELPIARGGKVCLSLVLSEKT